MLLLAPGVIAVGVGERTTPAGAERFARRAFAEGLAATVLAVPITQQRATMHLDTVCTMVDVDAIVMYPNVADTLMAYAVTCHQPNGDEGLCELEVAGPEPFLVAAAKAMGIDTLRQIDTGLDPVTAEREQWDDGNNTLAIAPRLTVAYERNVETNERLEQAGIEVVAIAGSELGSGRGGPRCMSCPVSRDPVQQPARSAYGCNVYRHPDDVLVVTDTDTAPPGFEETYTEHRLALVRLAFLMCGSRDFSEDLVQSVFTSAHPRWHEIDNHVAYLRRSVVNLAKDGQRQHFRRLRLAPPLQPAPVTSMPELDETWALILRLPSAQRAVVVLHYYEDLLSSR